jgi:hypothetical protein
VSRRGRQENNGNQEKLAHRGLHLMMATASPIQVRNYVIWVTPSAAPREMSVYSRGTCCRPLLPKIIRAAATSVARRITLTVQCAALLLRGTA